MPDPFASSQQWLDLRLDESIVIRAGGRIIGLQGIFWDVTAQKMAEEQIRRANTELARSREELRNKNLLMQESLQMESHDHDSKDNDSAKASWKGIMGGTTEVRG